MLNFSLSLLLATGVALAQYKAEPAGTPPSDLKSEFSAAVQKQGVKILSPNGSVFCEIWFRNSVPKGPKSTEQGVSFPSIPQGALLGVLHFPERGADRRGQTIKPGVYTLRYSLHPVNGDHQGVAPQRDFLLMVPIADDKDPKSTPGFDELVAMSRKASGTPHPAVLSITSSSADKASEFEKEGDSDWVLHSKIGELPIAVILVGRAEG